jgi:DNA-binding NarL/FixJ family response regulator
MTTPTPTDLKTTDFRKDIRLLVVDDSEEHYQHLCEITEMYNPQYKVECSRAPSVEELPAHDVGVLPTVILLDLHLLSDALQVIQKLSHQGYPVVATSAVRSPGLAETAQSYGAVGYFSKSDNPEDIEALVEFVASVAVTPQENH